MEQMNLVLDFILIAASIWMIVSIKNLGGMFGKSYVNIAWGSILLGLAHAIETVTFEMLQWDIVLVELIHRLIVLAGFVLIICGFYCVRSALKAQ